MAPAGHVRFKKGQADVITVWRGSANTWDCDEMGHMNVRIYVEKAMEGIANFAARIELPLAFKQGGTSTLMPKRQHMRFIREVHPGRPLNMQACILEIGADSFWLYQELRHGDGTPAAAFRTELQHVTSKTGRPFAWSERTRKALETYRDTPPEDTQPRSLDPNQLTLEAADARLETVHSVGAPLIGVGTVRADQCDLNNRMRTEWFMGRISDSVPNLLYDWRAKVAAAAGDKPMGAAVLEYLMVYRGWPQTGDRFEIYSSLARAERKYHSIVHWMIDPATGKAWLTSEAIAVTFDLEARKILPTEADQMDQLSILAPPGLRV